MYQVIASFDGLASLFFVFKQVRIQRYDTHTHTHTCKNYSFLGHKQALCPCFLHIPHSLGCLAGGTPVAVVEEEDTVGVVVVVVEEDAVVIVLAVVEVLVVGLVIVGSGSASLR